MKFLLLVLATILVAVSAVLHPLMVEQEWNSFKSKYVKVYHNANEEAKRLAIFQQNLIKIEQHNKLYEQGLSTFKIGVTPFADMTSEEFMAYVNRSSVQSRPQVGGEKVVLPNVNDPPKSIDWRTKNVLTPVKNQGLCGSGWAFATTGAMEAQYALKTGKLISLSEQQLMDCSVSYGNNGCYDGSIDDAFKYVHDHYISYEDSYPYEAKEEKCRQAKASPVKVARIVDLFSTHENIRNAVVKTPLAVAVDITPYWHLYKGGVLEDTTCDYNILNHSVLLVGYDEDYQYWIIKNSWGGNWGEGGYIRLSFTTPCGIEEHASFPILA